MNEDHWAGLKDLLALAIAIGILVVVGGVVVAVFWWLTS